MICTVTAIAPDGSRETITLEARSVNYAVIGFNAEAVCRSSASLKRPAPETAFEVGANGRIYRTTWARVLAWSNRPAVISSLR